MTGDRRPDGDRAPFASWDANGKRIKTPAEVAEINGDGPLVTRAESELRERLNKAIDALTRREYDKLTSILFDAARRSHSMTLLGPEGVDAIPVNDNGTQAVIDDSLRWKFDGDYDSPTGAGDAVEADRG